MKHIKTLLLLTSLSVLPLTACNNGSNALPLETSPRTTPGDSGGSIYLGGGGESGNGTPGYSGSGEYTHYVPTQEVPINGSKTGGGGGGGANPAVPEPTTMFFFGTGLAGLALVRRRRNRIEVESED
ncbi:MAG: PEP-CTERM sorting domain-containing protein [Planctomycetes bacterium]|nr:PEP-CTERM sorting domain-containing protein [Planctomycetota bacterium]MCB9891698.1 PEP-CTERM sorting domain-containing protein [Planctomycetota bacterium]MCB9918745.1 PEP-CTERM sorting domain-containing protein [Planctomycetota bacterium]